MIKKKTSYIKLIGSLTKDGKRIFATKMLNDIFFDVSKLTKIPVQLIHNRIEKRLNAYMEVKNIKRGKRTHVVPVPIGFKRQNFLIRKWLISSAKENYKKISFKEKLQAEILDVITKRKSRSLVKKINLYKHVRSNRSNLHFRW